MYLFILSICLIIVYYSNYQRISSLCFLQPQYHERQKAIITNKNKTNKVSNPFYI